MDQEENIVALVQEGESVFLEKPDGGLVDLGDGTYAKVGDGEDSDALENDEDADDFFVNLAETLDEETLAKLASKYLDLIESDNDKRKERIKSKADALNRSGLAGPAPGGADFDGASKITQTTYLEARVDFSASIMRQAFPATGPFAVKVPKKAKQDRLEAADRKVRFLNHQSINDPSFMYSAYERAIYELPDSGTSFIKHIWKPETAMVESEYRPIERVSVPPMVNDFYKTPRLFDKIYLNKYEFQKRQRSGLYVELPDEDENRVSQLDLNDAEMALLKKAGVDEPDNDDKDDSLRVLEEGTIIDDEVPDDYAQGAAVEYIMTIDEATRKVIGLYRHYDRETLEPLSRNFTKMDFIPGPDIFGYSLYDLIGGTTTATTGIVRALIDSGFMQTNPLLFKLKGPGTGRTLTIQPNQVNDITGDAAVDDIRKVLMQISLGQPSPTLMTLLEFLTREAKGVVSTAEEQVTDNSSRMPVGTAMALLEAGAKIYASIHLRIYLALKASCTIIQKQFFEYMPEDRLVYGTGEDDYVLRSDFAVTEDIVPASDPQVFSEAQRGMQAQVVMGIAQQYPTLVNQLVAIRRYFELLKVPNYEELLPPSQDKALHPVAENVSLASGKFYPAFPPQDHLAHIQVHLDFLTSPVLGSSPFLLVQVFPLFLQHLQQHMVYFYAVLMQEAASQQLGRPIDKEMEQIGDNWDGAAEIDRTLAQVSNGVISGQVTQTLGQVTQILSQMQMQLQQMAPPMQDPAVIQATAFAQDVQNRAQSKQGELQVKMQELQGKAEKAMAQFQLDIRKLQNELEIERIREAGSLQRNEDDNLTALMIAEKRTGADRMPNSDNLTGV